MSFLPPADLEYLTSKGLAFEEVEQDGKKAVIFPARRLPDGRFDAASADVLVFLPKGYPDVAPDMFHALPWLKLKKTNAYPRKADQSVTFCGKNWQRWSRHNKEWRPGTDGIWTVLKRIETALVEAA